MAIVELMSAGAPCGPWLPTENSGSGRFAHNGEPCRPMLDVEHLNVADSDPRSVLKLKGISDGESPFWERVRRWRL